MRSWNPLTQPFQRPYAPVAAGLRPEAEAPAKTPAWLRGLVGVTRALSALEATGIYGLEAADPFNIIPGSKDDRPFKERLKSAAYLARDVAGLTPLGMAAAQIGRLPGVSRLIPDELVPFDKETSGLRAAAEYGIRRVPKLPGEDVMDTSGTSERAFGARVAERYYNWQDAPGGDFQKTVIGILADPTTWMTLGGGGAVKAGAKGALETAGEAAIKRAGRELAGEAAERAARQAAESAAQKQIGRAILRNAGRGVLEAGLGVGPKRAVPFAFGAAAGQEAGRWITDRLPGDNTFLQVAGPLAGAVLGGGLGAGAIRDASAIRLGAVEEGAEAAARRAAQQEAQTATRETALLEAYSRRLERVPGWQNSYYAEQIPPELAALLGLRPDEVAVLYTSTPDNLYGKLRNEFFNRQMGRLSPAERRARAEEINKAADAYASATKNLIDQVVNYRSARSDIELAGSDIAAAREADREAAAQRLAPPELPVPQARPMTEEERARYESSVERTEALQREAEERRRQDVEAMRSRPRPSEFEGAYTRERPETEAEPRQATAEEPQAPEPRKRQLPVYEEEPGNPFWRETDEDPEITLARADRDGLRTEENSSPVEFDIEEGEGYYYVSLFHEDQDPRAQFDRGATRLVEDAFDMQIHEIRRDPVLRARAARAFEQIREAISDYYYRRVIRAEQTETTIGDELRLPWESIAIDGDGNVRFHHRRLQFEDRAGSDEDARVAIETTQREAEAIPRERTNELGLPAIEMEQSDQAAFPMYPAARAREMRIERPDVAPPGKPSSLSETMAWREADVRNNAPNAAIVVDGKNDLGLPDPREMVAPPHRNTTAKPNYEVMRGRAEAQGKVIARTLAEKNPEGPVVIAIRYTPERLNDADFALAREAASLLSSQVRKALREMAANAEGAERERLLRLADNVYVIPQLRPDVPEAVPSGPRWQPSVYREQEPHDERRILAEARETSRRQNPEQERLREEFLSTRTRQTDDGEEIVGDVSDQDIVSVPRRTGVSREEPGLEGRTPRKYETVRIRVRGESPYLRRTGGRPEDVEAAPIEDVIRPRLTDEAEEPADLREIREAFEEARTRPGAESRARAAKALRPAVYELQDTATDLDRMASRWTSSADDQRAVFVDRPAPDELADRRRALFGEDEDDALLDPDVDEARREEAAKRTANRIIRATKDLLAGKEAPDDETGGLRETYYDVADRTEGTTAMPMPDDGNLVEGQPYLPRAQAAEDMPQMRFHPRTGRWVPNGTSDAVIRSYAPRGVRGPQSGRMRVTAVVSKRPYLLLHNGRLNQYWPAYITIWWRNESGELVPVRTMYTVHAESASRIAAMLTDITTAINTLFDARVFAQERRTGMVRAVVDPIGALAYALALANRTNGYRPVEVAENFMRRLESILGDPSPARVNEALITLASIRDAALRNAGYAVSADSTKIPTDPIAKTRREIARELKPRKAEQPPRARAPDAGGDSGRASAEERLGRPLTEEEKAKVDEYRAIIRRALGKETEERQPNVEERIGDLADAQPDAIVITVNLDPDSRSYRGTHKIAVDRYPQAHQEWLAHLRAEIAKVGPENRAQLLGKPYVVRLRSDGQGPRYIIFVPTKILPKSGPEHATRPETVEQAATEIRRIAEELNLSSVAMPILGAGLGGLDPRQTAQRLRSLLSGSKVRFELWQQGPPGQGARPVLREHLRTFEAEAESRSEPEPASRLAPEAEPNQEPRRVLPPDAAHHGPDGKVDGDRVELDQAAVREAAADETPVAEASVSTKPPLGKVTEEEMLELGYVRDPDGVWTKKDPKAWPWQRIRILSRQASLRRRSVLAEFRAAGEQLAQPDAAGREKVISLGTYEAPQTRRTRPRRGLPTPDDPDPLYRSDPEGEIAEALQYQIHPFNAHIKLSREDRVSLTEALRKAAERSGRRPVGSFEGKIEDFRTSIIRRGAREGHVGFHGADRQIAQVKPRTALEPGELPEMVQVARLYGLYFSQHPERWEVLSDLLGKGWVLSDNVFTKGAWESSPAVPIALLYESGFKPDPRFAGDFRPSAFDVIDYMRGKKSLDEIAPPQTKDVELAENAPMACVFDALGLEG